MPNPELPDFEACPPGFSGVDIEPPPLIERERPTASLALDVAGRCNIACRYCAESATQPSHRALMSEAVLRKALGLLMPEGRARPGSSIRLGSGEPLLAKRLLMKLEALLETGADESERPRVFLTTNGTLADAETRRWLAGTGWAVKVSLDGPRDIQDRWRVTAKGEGTYRQVSEVVADLAARMPDRLSVTAVLCRGSDPVEVFEGIACLGVRRIELVPAVHPDPEIAPGDGDLRRYAEFAQRWVDRYVAAGSDSRDKDGAGRWPELVRLVNIARRVMGYDVARVPCGAGRNFYGVGADGSLYPCFRFVGDPAFRIGDLAGGVDADGAARFRADAGRPYDRRAACRSCWAAALCGGPCFASAQWLGSGGGEPYPMQCRYIRADAHAAVVLVDRLRQSDPERLLGLLGPWAKDWEHLLASV